MYYFISINFFSCFFLFTIIFISFNKNKVSFLCTFLCTLFFAKATLRAYLTFTFFNNFLSLELETVSLKEQRVRKKNLLNCTFETYLKQECKNLLLII